MLVVWPRFTFIAVTVLAGLKTLPGELIESAQVDGGGPWRIFWRVTYPLLKPIFLVLALLSIIWDFGVFTQVYLVIGELGNRDEYNLGIYAYDRAFASPPSYGAASALAFILTVILLIITVGYIRASIGKERSIDQVLLAPGAAGRAERPGAAGRAGHVVSIFWMVSTAFAAREIYSLTPHPLPLIRRWRTSARSSTAASSASRTGTS